MPQALTEADLLRALRKLARDFPARFTRVTILPTLRKSRKFAIGVLHELDANAYGLADRVSDRGAQVKRDLVRRVETLDNLIEKSVHGTAAEKAEAIANGRHRLHPFYFAAVTGPYIDANQIPGLADHLQRSIESLDHELSAAGILERAEQTAREVKKAAEEALDKLPSPGDALKKILLTAGLVLGGGVVVLLGGTWLWNALRRKAMGL